MKIYKSKDVLDQVNRVYPNARNGLIFFNMHGIPFDGISYFLSTHAHNSSHYFDAASMPIDAMYRLLKGENIAVVDCSCKHDVPDSLRTGLGSWVYAFNYAIGFDKNALLYRNGRPIQDIVPWSTPAMRKYAWFSEESSKVRKMVRRLQNAGNLSPVRVGLRLATTTGKTIKLNTEAEREEIPCTNYVYGVVPISKSQVDFDDQENIRKGS